MRTLVSENILVTGGAGFIGSNLIDSLLLEDVSSIVAIDNFFLGDESNLAFAYKSNKFKLYHDDAGGVCSTLFTVVEWERFL